MKKFSFTLLCLLMISLAGFSQYNRQYYRLGIHLGIASNYLGFKNEDGKVKSRKTGFHIGVLNYFQAGPHFAIQSNLQLAMKGGQLHEIEFTTWHLDLPINFLITDGSFFFGGGPYVSFGLFGRGKGENPEPDGPFDIYTEEKPDFLFRQPEGGLNAVIGFNFAKAFLLQANFSQGLTNRYWGQDGYKVRSKALGLSVAYLFRKFK